MDASFREQMHQLVEQFPVRCKVRVVAENLPGEVSGYRALAETGRRDEMGLIVLVPGDVWVLSPDQVSLRE